MFVYKTPSIHRGDSSGSERKVESYFNVAERWNQDVTSNSLLVIMCALLFGGVAKVFSFVPLVALVSTVMVLAWLLGDETVADEPKWINRLSLASTGLLYLGLGYCFGAVVLILVPVAAFIARKR